MSRCDLEQIKVLDWRKAKGVKSTGQTNSMLAPRNYNIPCKLDFVIAITGGVWNWYCTNHHQPDSHCERDKMKLILDSNCLVMLPENKKDMKIDEWGRPILLKETER